MDDQIFDEDGEWVRNACAFPFVDGQGRRYDAGALRKVKVQGWVKVQVDAGVLTLAEPPEHPLPTVAAGKPEAVAEPEAVAKPVVKAPAKPTAA